MAELVVRVEDLEVLETEEVEDEVVAFEVGLDVVLADIDVVEVSELEVPTTELEVVTDDFDVVEADESMYISNLLPAPQYS